jgi:phytoene desaturase
MRLGAKGYQVTLLDRLDRAGGRGSSITQNGHRFDLGPTIVTVPQVFRQLWAECGRDFDKDVDLRPVDPYYEIRWRDGSNFRVRQDEDAMIAEVRRLFPKDEAGYRKFLKDSEERYQFGFEGLGRRPMNKLMDLVREIPGFVRLRADRSVYGHAKARVKDPRLQMALSFPSAVYRGRPDACDVDVHPRQPPGEGIRRPLRDGRRAGDGRRHGPRDRGSGRSRAQGVEVDEILTRNGARRGVRTTDGEEIAADIVVSNADPGHTYGHLLRRAKRKRWTDRRLNRSRWSMGLFVWYFGTKGTRGKWRTWATTRS